MSREIIRFNSPFPTQQVFNMFLGFWKNEGFQPYLDNGEQCMKKGHGVATAPQFVKITALGGIYTLEAWIKFAVVPGVYAGEMDLNGFTGAVPKGALRERVTRFLQSVHAQTMP